MADSKITALDNLTSADPANDMIPIVDVSATPPASGNTKRISINNLLACSPSATLASATITGDLTVRTNKLAVTSTGVGFGIATPATALQVVGEIRSSADISNSSDAVIYSFAGGTAGTVRAGLQLIGSTPEIRAYLSGTTAMTLNSTGLGVGVTPSAWQNSVKALQVGTQSAAWQYSSTLFLTNNRYFDGANKYIGNGYSLSYHQNPSTGTHEWYYSTNNSSGAGAALNPVEAMRLDASGNLIWSPASTPPTLTTNGQLTVNATSNTNLRFSYRGSDGTTRVANITLA